jgi:hypothetical protein
MKGGSDVPEDAVDCGIRTAVYSAAIPVGIDVAELDAGGVVNVESEGGDDDAGEGEQDDQETGHRLQVTGYRLWVMGYG